jgi:hypothetical protein
MLDQDSKIQEMTERMLLSSTIDDPSETRLLLQEMEASLPIPIRLTPQGAAGLQARGTDIIAIKQELVIEKILYSGDMGGILCSVRLEEQTDDGKKTHIGVISLTHLHIDPNHPLAPKIKAYQKKRIMSLAVLDGSHHRRSGNRKKNKKGFGS